MEDKYFVIHNGDGDTTVNEYTKKELIAEIEDNAWGDAVAFENIPNDNDTNYWGGGILIIKGKIIKPREKEVVIKFDVD